jgi:hypothetical protein
VKKLANRVYYSQATSTTVRELIQLKEYARMNADKLKAVEHQNEMKYFLETGDHLKNSY